MSPRTIATLILLDNPVIVPMPVELEKFIPLLQEKGLINVGPVTPGMVPTRDSYSLTQAGKEMINLICTTSEYAETHAKIKKDAEELLGKAKGKWNEALESFKI